MEYGELYGVPIALAILTNVRLAKGKYPSLFSRCNSDIGGK